jgi:hypothetical protein
MSTTPPEEPTTTSPSAPPSSSSPGYIGVNSGAILPIPGNAELIVWLLVIIVIAIVAGISERVDAGSWVTSTTFLTVAYILSRGIAKASRVLEQ